MKNVILLSGCSQGLGKYLAESLASEGHTVYAGVRKNEDAVRFEKEKKDTNITFVKLDITNNDDCQETIKKILQKEKKLNVLINNAGNTISGPITDFTDKDFLRLLDVNTVGAFRLISSAIPAMKGRGGKIINITSLNGLLALPNFSLYCASKFALQALGDSLFYELAKENIYVTNLSPGAIKHPEGRERTMSHKGAREKFLILKLLMPFVTYQTILHKIVSVIDAKHPPREVILGNDAHITLLLQRFSPNFVWESLMMYVWKK